MTFKADDGEVEQVAKRKQDRDLYLTHKRLAFVLLPSVSPSASHDLKLCSRDERMVAEIWLALI